MIRSYPLLLLTVLVFAALRVGLAGGESDVVVGEGVIRSDEKVQLKSKLPYPIRGIAVKEGEIVRRGQLLVELANDVDRARVAQVELELEIARRELERNLKVPDLITEKELELSRDAARKAEAALRLARANLAETVLRASFDGLVSRVYVRLGDTPKMSETVLLELISLDKLYAEVAFPLPYLSRIRQGMLARLTVEDEHASIKTSLTGTVSYIYPEIDLTTRMFRAKVDVPLVGSLVLPGMFVKVAIKPLSPAR